MRYVVQHGNPSVQVIRRRRSALAMIALSVAMAACTIDSLTFVPSASDETGTEAGADGPNRDTDGGTDASADAIEEFVVLVDGSDPDALIVKDSGGGKVDAAGCTATTCDCDQDGYNDHGLAACVNSPGPDDCDDQDKRTHPGQGFLEDPAAPPKNGDWNCVGGVEKLYPANVNCGLVDLGSCATKQGFQSDPGCGELGTYVFCQATAILCLQASKTEQRVQACK
jgi:hypothetical protein